MGRVPGSTERSNFAFSQEEKPLFSFSTPGFDKEYSVALIFRQSSLSGTESTIIGASLHKKTSESDNIKYSIFSSSHGPNTSDSS